MVLQKHASGSTRPPQARQDAPLPVDLTSFDITPERGFLPRRDPLATLPDRWPAFLNDLAQALPKLLAARQLRAYVDALRESWSNSLGNRDLDELRSAARILSFAGHGY